MSLDRFRAPEWKRLQTALRPVRLDSRPPSSRSVFQNSWNQFPAKPDRRQPEKPATSDVVSAQRKMGRPSKRAPQDIPPWARRLKKAREDKGLTQEQLGELISISYKSISNWETGVHEPNLAQFAAIAEATGVEAPWIVFGPADGKPSSPDSLPGVIADADKAHRHLIWALYKTWLFMSEERLEPNWPELVSFVHYIVAAAENSPDEAHAQEAMSRKLEAERAGLRADLEKVRKKRLNPVNPEIGD